MGMTIVSLTPVEGGAHVDLECDASGDLFVDGKNTGWAPIGHRIAVLEGAGPWQLRHVPTGNPEGATSITVSLDDPPPDPDPEPEPDPSDAEAEATAIWERHAGKGVAVAIFFLAYLLLWPSIESVIDAAADNYRMQTNVMKAGQEYPTWAGFDHEEGVGVLVSWPDLVTAGGWSNVASFVQIGTSKPVRVEPTVTNGVASALVPAGSFEPGLPVYEVSITVHVSNGDIVRPVLLRANPWAP